jgi:anti-sigma B factor antagonist
MPGEDLTLTTETEGAASIVHVVGELDLSTISVFEAEIERSISDGLVVVELSECAFIDSSALRSLVRTHRTLRDVGGELALVAPSQPARRVLEIAALDQLLPVFGSVGEAVRSLA